MEVSIDYGDGLLHLEGKKAEEVVKILESENLPPFIRVEDQKGRTRYINPRYIVEVIVYD